jgi:hypothetical protein
MHSFFKTHTRFFVYFFRLSVEIIVITLFLGNSMIVGAIVSAFSMLSFRIWEGFDELQKQITRLQDREHAVQVTNTLYARVLSKQFSSQKLKKLLEQEAQAVAKETGTTIEVFVLPT